MNSTIRTGLLTLFVLAGALILPAQTQVMPGEISLPAVERTSEAAPLQLRPNGEIWNSPLNPVAEVRNRSDRRTAMLWKISMAAMIGATAFDAATSMGKHESNPLLRSSDGSFGAKGIAIKGGLAGLALAPQFFLRKHKEFRKAFITANFIDTGIFMTVATHNLGIGPNKK